MQTVIEVPKFNDTRSLHEIQRQLTNDIRACDNMISDDPADQWDQMDLISELQDMCEQLDQIEGLLTLKSRVDCDCFYNPNHEGRA